MLPSLLILGVLRWLRGGMPSHVSARRRASRSSSLFSSALVLNGCTPSYELAVSSVKPTSFTLGLGCVAVTEGGNRERDILWVI